MQPKNFIPGSPAGWSIEPLHTMELGARMVPGGVNFSVYSRHAQRIHVALFRANGFEPEAVLPLPSCHGHVFQGFVPGLESGWQYGFYAEGPFDPPQGHRFNPAKLLLDPYARALHGTFRNPDGILCGHVPGGEDADLVLDHRPSHAFMPKCVITDSRFDWQGDRSPSIPRDRILLYEMHVRGFTAHPSSGVKNPGTFLGLIEKIPYLKSLGVNSLELLPVHARCSEGRLIDQGLSNYWGYNTAGFFALEPGYGSGSHPGCEIDEFKLMVRELHRAGIEVILDVVYNHTAEGTETGPTLSFRGLDNKSYYTLTGPEEEPLRRYRNHTGCGNMLEFGNPWVVRLTLDSLRYFVEEFHVDGFRFDLATVLGRQGGSAFNPLAPFFAAAAQDPVLQRVKLISEPWDLEGYELGRFPDGWLEWNDSFRDVTRRWVRGDADVLPALREKLEGSPGVYETAGREPWSSINFVTCHDGFTLRDLTRHNHKHNEANGEGNRDGNDTNFSWNCGFEGVGGGAEVEALRQRQARNLLLLTLLARGTPMLLGGDEYLRTQGGNNNAYCQDNPISWYDWDRVENEKGFLHFFRELMKWRSKLQISNTWTSVSNRAWGRCWVGLDSMGLPWPEDNVPHARHAAFLLNDSSFCLILNSGDEGKSFHLPALPVGRSWGRIVDTSLNSPEDVVSVEKGPVLLSGEFYLAPARSSILLGAMQTSFI